MLSAKDEKNAIGATLFFNIAHYALRPWPWILVALASLIVFPNLESLQTAFPKLDPKVINDDLAYPAMLTFLPSGLMGFVIASLIAAFMSTISTHLNWGSSYIVNDFYKRFVRPDATEKNLVAMGRISTVVLMALAALVALALENALQAFNILLQIGAGTGLLFILRWFWWRINAFSEITAMVVSFFIAVYFQFGYSGSMADWEKLVLGVGLTTAAWIVATFLTRPTDQKKLESFYLLIQPHSIGWKPVIEKAKAGGQIADNQVNVGQLPAELLCMFLGVFMVYGALFTTGFWIYGNIPYMLAGLVSTLLLGFFLWKVWNRK